MSIEVKVPALPESVADATIAAWHKKVGEKVARDENLVDLETDKVVLEVPAPADGVLTEILFKEGDTVTSAQLLARIEAGSTAAAAPAAPKAVPAEPAQAQVSAPAPAQSQSTKATGPAVRRMLAENNLQPEQLSGSGKDGRLTKEDVVAFIESNREKSAGATAAPARSEPVSLPPMGAREERRVPMTRLRAKIAERLVQAQHNAAMLTTFNEVNLKAVMDLRAQYKDLFEKKHGVKLGFMSLFTKAVVESLKRFPAVNASIDGQDIVYHGYYDVGIAVSTDKGLVVPVVRDADQLSLAEIEKVIADSASRARLGKLSLEEMQGGTFTITNGGVFGSLLATPIINPPQTGILGMHKIEDRPVVEKGQIVIRPMMYVALSYDHRLIDGRESVQFLVSVKELLEDPARLLLNV
ncbi:dihydrolipoamide succinyltransferase subunit E2 [Legionella rubrilucens]|uniref:Dihydrolipoyllysine-residue succinyltransferase component of 2-oxoglutarate dehydrogenase complex n=1 Tax=Legionella rubrilucens TaxID=458 RepID=A0A0W0XQ88_9GAMM|nr:2-oxoglutarate dehydrogenase complex dihydrolipoyllysine-residue succinyltransferase [Legionella rubrilucens]KTD46766.1 dihydrolipoamide succinyltransferase subunit E2 [Legionella rubrilucens]